MSRRAAGFTLLEVLVALVLVAAALTLGYTSICNATLGSERLQQRVLAQWFADDARAEIAIGARLVGEQAETIESTMYGRALRAQLAPSASGDAVEITVIDAVDGETLATAQVERP